MRICIDPGHGGSDPGATGNGLLEKELCLNLALKLREALEAYKCQVKMTREKDDYISLSERTRMANDWPADLFFSIHVNSHTKAEANGYEDYIYPVTPAKTQDIQKAIHASLAKVWTNARRMNRGMKTANFHVLRETLMAAVLVENGFITNSLDAELLKQYSFHVQLVEAMTVGIANALGLEKKEDKGTFIVGELQVTLAQAQGWARSRNAHQRFVDIAPFYWSYGRQIGIRPEVAYCQAAKETAFGHYGGVVKPEQNNWAGIKTRKSANGDRQEDHETFSSPEDGVRAHYNHLAAYVGKEPIGEPHGRYYLVKSLPWAGTIKYVEELGGKWAPDSDYGNSIIRDYLTGLFVTKMPPEVDKTKELEQLRKENLELQQKLTETFREMETIRDKLNRIKAILHE